MSIRQNLPSVRQFTLPLPHQDNTIEHPTEVPEEQPDLLSIVIPRNSDLEKRVLQVRLPLREQDFINRARLAVELGYNRGSLTLAISAGSLLGAGLLDAMRLNFDRLAFSVFFRLLTFTSVCFILAAREKSKMTDRLEMEVKARSYFEFVPPRILLNCEHNVGETKCYFATLQLLSILTNRANLQDVEHG